MQFVQFLILIDAPLDSNFVMSGWGNAWHINAETVQSFCSAAWLPVTTGHYRSLPVTTGPHCLDPGRGSTHSACSEAWHSELQDSHLSHLFLSDLTLECPECPKMSQVSATSCWNTEVSDSFATSTSMLELAKRVKRVFTPFPKPQNVGCSTNRHISLLKRCSWWQNCSAQFRTGQRKKMQRVRDSQSNSPRLSSSQPEVSLDALTHQVCGLCTSASSKELNDIWRRQDEDSAEDLQRLTAQPNNLFWSLGQSACAVLSFVFCIQVRTKPWSARTTRSASSMTNAESMWEREGWIST